MINSPSSTGTIASTTLSPFIKSSFSTQSSLVGIRISQALSLSTTDPVLKHTVALLDYLLPPPRAFGVNLWDGFELPASGQPEFNLALKHPGALRRMFTPPITLCLGESYSYGDFVIEGNLFSAFSLVDAIATYTIKPGEVAGLARELFPTKAEFSSSDRPRPSSPARSAAFTRARPDCHTIPLRCRR